MVRMIGGLSFPAVLVEVHVGVVVEEEMILAAINAENLATLHVSVIYNQAGQTMVAGLEVVVHGIVGAQVMERVQCVGATHHAVILHIEGQSVLLNLIVTMQDLGLQMGAHIIEIVSGTEVAAHDNLDVFCR